MPCRAGTLSHCWIVAPLIPAGTVARVGLPKRRLASHSSALSSWRISSLALERSRWSARSVARTNDLDADEQRRTMWPSRQCDGPCNAAIVAMCCMLRGHTMRTSIPAVEWPPLIRRNNPAPYGAAARDSVWPWDGTLDGRMSTCWPRPLVARSAKATSAPTPRHPRHGGTPAARRSLQVGGRRHRKCQLAPAASQVCGRAGGLRPGRPNALIKHNAAPRFHPQNVSEVRHRRQRRRTAAACGRGCPSAAPRVRRRHPASRASVRPAGSDRR